MVQSPLIGSIVRAELINHLTLNKALVRLNGKELVLQFNQTISNEKNIQVQITGVKGEILYGKMLPQTYTVADILKDVMPSLFGMDMEKAVEVVKLLQLTGLPITGESVRKLLQLSSLFKDPDLALAAYIKNVPPQELEAFLASLAGIGLKNLLKLLEKNVKQFSKRADGDNVLEETLRGLGRRNAGLLDNIVLLFSPDFFGRLIRDEKSFQQHFKYLLLKLRKLQLAGHESAADTESLIRILDLNDVKSLALNNYAAEFITLFWKDDEDNDWKTMEMSIRAMKNGEETDLVLVADFPRLGTLNVRFRYSESVGLRSTAIGAKDEMTLDLLRRELTLEGAKDMANVTLSFYRLSDETGSFYPSNIKKIDLTI